MIVPADDDWMPPPSRRPARTKPPARARSETERTQEVIAFLKTLPHTYAFKKHTSAHGEAGHPDVFACHGGRMVLVEMKVPGDKPTALQMQRLINWRAAGAAVCWAYEVEHVRELLARTAADPAYRNPLTGPGAP